MATKKLLAYCFGVENSIDRYKLLFLDIDEPNLPAELLIRLNTDPKIPAYLILQTKNGYHIVCFRPFKTEAWKEKLGQYSEFIDPMFYTYSIKNCHSVLRISPKYSLKDGKTVLSPAPVLHKFVEQDKYIETPISMLYRSIYHYDTYLAQYNSRFISKARIHLYLTPSE